MIEVPDLSVAYIRKYAESAARVLASMEPDDIAVFLQNVPTECSVQLLAKMNPRRSSLIIRQMGAEDGAIVLRNMHFTDVTTILRQIDAVEREQFLAELPGRLRRDFKTSMDFPADTVGANMTTAIATAQQSETTSAVLDLVRQSEGDHADVFFVVDSQRKLVGAVTVTRLVGRPDNTPLSEMLDTACVSLSPQARLDTIAGLDAWHNYSRLPVVSRTGELIGAISRQALRRAVIDREDDKHANVASLAESMTGALTASIVGLTDLLTATSGEVARQEDFHGD